MIASRNDLKEYCLRRLGKPVININVDDSQVEDRIDDALQYFVERHIDATESDWVYYEVTQVDVDNGYLSIPDHIISISEMIPFSSIFAKNDMAAPQYQIMLSMANDMGSWTRFSQIDYFMTMTNYQSTMELITPLARYNFNIHSRRLKIYDGELVAGKRIAMRVYLYIDPEDVISIYNDRWLKAYATALIKRQWGENMMKFNEVQLLGGVTLNGRDVYDLANDDIQKLEEQLKQEYQEPVGFIFG